MTPLEIAIKEIGTKENPAGSNKVKYNTWYYGKVVSGGGYPWCCVFVQWCYAQAGTPLPYKTASCTDLLNWYRSHDPGCIVKTPKPNDLAIMCFGKGRYHIGIVHNKPVPSTVTTVEGNTSITSDDAGGSVMLRAREVSLIVAYIRPRVTIKPTAETTTLQQQTGGGNMNTVKGSTESEKTMIKAIQTAVAAIADGEIGTQTMSDIACMIHADCFPLTLKIYDTPCIIARDIVPFAAAGASLSDFTNTINGSFYANNRPCSILVQDGLTVHNEACHASYGKPESVIYRTFSGDVGIVRATTAKDLPQHVLWAVGGMGLLNNYNPTAEGFCKITSNGVTKDFSDVLRKSNHAMMGEKNGYIYLVYCANKTADEVNAIAKKFGLRVAIMLDGGHVAGINGAETFAKINVKTAQYCAIQGVR